MHIDVNVTHMFENKEKDMYDNVAVRFIMSDQDLRGKSLGPFVGLGCFRAHGQFNRCSITQWAAG